MEEDLKQVDGVDEDLKRLIDHYIVNPVQPDDNGVPVIMVMVQSEGRMYVGGSAGINEDMIFNLIWPLRISEGLVQTPSGEVVPRTGLDPVSYSLDLMDVFTVRASAYYLLQKSSGGDQAMVSNYAAVYQEAFAARSGIVAPTVKDISNLAIGNFGNGPRK